VRRQARQRWLRGEEMEMGTIRVMTVKEEKRDRRQRCWMPPG
jgi:hypothetical protein